MSTSQAAAADPYPPVPVDLKDPIFAAFLAWLLPGAGHMYQRRWGKGGLFMACILSTFFFGLYLGDGKVVYAAWKPDEPRYAYLCQVAVGVPALPALVQTIRVRSGNAPLFSGVMAPPRNADDLAERHENLHRYFELGTVYTMIAGLLNILAIYDAWGGPVYFEGKEEEDGPPKDKPPPGGDPPGKA